MSDINIRQKNSVFGKTRSSYEENKCWSDISDSHGEEYEGRTLSRVVWQILADVLYVLADSIIRVIYFFEKLLKLMYDVWCSILLLLVQWSVKTEGRRCCRRLSTHGWMHSSWMVVSWFQRRLINCTLYSSS
jgi:hypothetical protein